MKICNHKRSTKSGIQGEGSDGTICSDTDISTSSYSQAWPAPPRENWDQSIIGNIDRQGLEIVV